MKSPSFKHFPLILLSGGHVMAKKKAELKPPRPVPTKAPRVKYPFPRTTLEKAIQIPYAIRDKNGGNPWEPEEIRKAVDMAQGNPWYYLTAAARDYGLTIGTREADQIALAELGREIVCAPNPEAEGTLKQQAFLNIDIFKRVLEYYKGSNLPDMKYLSNVLTKQFGLDPETHEEFAERSCFFDFLKSDPEMDSLRSAPRFQNLVLCMNFPRQSTARAGRIPGRQDGRSD